MVKSRRRLKQLLRANQKHLIEKLRSEWNEFEKEKRRKAHREHIKEMALDSGKIILALLLVGGILTVAAVAPNIFAAFGRRGRRAYFSKYDLDKRTNYLKKKGLIEIEKQNKETSIISLTREGREQALIPSFDQLSIRKQDIWDGIWRIIFFDIPESRKWERGCFRTRLEKIGCYPLQKSVFVTPYPCQTEIQFLASLFTIDRYIHLIETQSSFQEKNLELYRYFNLP